MPLKTGHWGRCMDALRLAQYSRLAAESFSLYSGVSHWDRLALYSGEFMVAFKRSLRCASAAGSDIFSRLRSWAALIPATLFSLMLGSLFKTLWKSRIGFETSKSLFRFASITSGLGFTTPSPPSVKLVRVPPSDMRLKCAIKDFSSWQASSQEIFTKRCTLMFAVPYFCTTLKHKGFLSRFLMHVGFHRPEVFPIPT